MAASVVFKSFILLKFPRTFLVACCCNRFEVKSFQLVDCCCVVLNKLNSHCWSCSVKIQAWKIPCICVRPQDREMVACVSVQVVYIAKISTDISRCVLTRSLRSSKFSVDCCCVVLNKLNSHCWSCSVKIRQIQAWKILWCIYVRLQDREMRLSLGRNEHQIIKIC